MCTSLEPAVVDLIGFSPVLGQVSINVGVKGYCTGPWLIGGVAPSSAARAPG
jgi:hypothetical protein